MTRGSSHRRWFGGQSHSFTTYDKCKKRHTFKSTVRIMENRSGIFDAESPRKVIEEANTVVSKPE